MIKATWLVEDEEYVRELTKGWKGARPAAAYAGLRGQLTGCRILASLCPRRGPQMVGAMKEAMENDPYAKADVWSIDFKDTVVHTGTLEWACSTFSISVSNSQVIDPLRGDGMALLQTLTDEAARETCLLGWCPMGLMRLKGVLQKGGGQVLLPRDRVLPISRLVEIIERS